MFALRVAPLFARRAKIANYKAIIARRHTKLCIAKLGLVRGGNAIAFVTVSAFVALVIFVVASLLMAGG
jgi:hypothetical protein